MLNLTELEQFAAFAELGTLSRAAERLHISQPTLTRTMRHVEDAFGVSLFRRGKNRIELNETGRLAAEYAQKLLFETEKAVQAFDRSLRTITVHSCAPAPLWSLLPLLSQRHAESTVSSKILDIQTVLSDVLSGRCDIGIEQVLGLEDIIKTRIVCEIDRKTLLEHDDALGLIWILEQIDSSLAAEKKGLLITDDISLAKFVHCCVLHGKVLVRSVEKTWRVKREHIAEYIDIDVAYRRICAFVKTEEFLMLAHNARQDIAAFLIEMELDSRADERNISLTSIEKKLNELANY